MRCRPRCAHIFVFILFSFFYDRHIADAQADAAGQSKTRAERDHNAAYAGKDGSDVPQPPNVISPVKSSIEVHADDLANQNISPVRAAYRDEIQSAAGAYQDYSRYLLLMPGVVSAGNSDSMNDVLVRGGHPSENLYVIDGLEVPYVNHFTVEGTPSGFTPMINTSSISKVELQPGAYDTQYSSRLSSLIEIETRDQTESGRSGEMSLNISGLGGFWNMPVGEKSSLLLAGDRSLFNLVTDDIGLDGVPIYTNGMARLLWSPTKNDEISVLSLSGGDTITVSPCAADMSESLTIDTQYGGLRSTNGLVWLHTHGPATVSKFSASYAMQQLDIAQQDQLVDGAYAAGMSTNGCTPSNTTSVYKQNALDSLTTLGYNLRHDFHQWMLSAGATGQIVNLDYMVSQPQGQQSPYNPNPTWTDAVNFHQTPMETQTGTYVEMTGPLGQRWTASAGFRMETFSMPGTHVWEPHAGLGFRISRHQAVHAAFRRSAQLPAYMDMLSYRQNESLLPEQADQLSFGADLWRTSILTLSAEAYRKLYRDEPVSTEYPSLMLANMVYKPGDQIVWLPLKTAGRGRSSGIELLLSGHFSNRLSTITSLTYSRTMYAALDGIYRSGNYDMPLVANSVLTWHFPHEWNLSVRDSYTTGRPYTPYNVPLSILEQRGIYDLAKVNALRGPAYNRMDISFDHSFRLRHGKVNLYAGVQNAFDRKNFFNYVWLDRCSADPQCVAQFHNSPQLEVFQMPAFPIAGFRWDF